MKDGEIIIYLGNIDDNRLIHNKQYKVRFNEIEKSIYWIKLNNSEHLGCDYDFIKNNFVSLKKIRKQKLLKLNQNETISSINRQQSRRLEIRF